MTKVVRRTVGRPRANKQVSEGPARDDILAASAQLFAQHGFKGTSTRMIADKVGIRQPSLFHHFSRKADILEELVDAGAKRLYEYLDKIDFDADPRLELFRLVAFDTHFLLTEPLGINKILALPEVRQGPLANKVKASQDRIIGVYRKLVSAGVESGYFQVTDLDIATYALFGMEESVWLWRDSELTDPAESALAIARMAMRALLKSPADLKKIEKLAGDTIFQ